MAINATNAAYDLTNITGGTGNILEFIQNVNDLTGQTFMFGMLLAGFVILYTSMRTTESPDAMLASGLIIAVMGFFFRAIGFIDTPKLIFILVAFAIIFVVSMIGKRQ